MRKPPDVTSSSSHRRLTFALLCAFAGCLNPRPEEYPSDTISPGNEASGAPAAENPMRQGDDGFENNAATDPNDAPDSDDPIVPAPDFLVPGPAPDAGVGDAGVGDAGASAISE